MEKPSVLYEFLFYFSEFLNCICVLKTLISHLSQFRREKKALLKTSAINLTGSSESSVLSGLI